MYNLATSTHPAYDEISYYPDIDTSRELIKPLINSICDYDPIFRESHEDLSNRVTDVVNKDSFAIQKFEDTLTKIKNKIADIKKDSINIRGELAIYRDNLILSIHATENEIDQLEGKKIEFQGRRETLEKELSQKQKEVNTYKTLSWIIPVLGVILKSVRAFDSLLAETKTQLNFLQEEIGLLMIEKNHKQQILEKSLSLLNANQHLTNSCDNIQNNINNIQTSLKRIENTSFLTNKLIALAKDWSALMNIIDEFSFGM